MVEGPPIWKLAIVSLSVIVYLSAEIAEMVKLSSYLTSFSENPVGAIPIKSPTAQSTAVSRVIEESPTFAEAANLVYFTDGEGPFILRVPITAMTLFPISTSLLIINGDTSFLMP